MSLNGVVNGTANGHGLTSNGTSNILPNETKNSKKPFQEPVKLIFELIWLSVIALPMIIYAGVKKFLKPNKKSLAGETVLITGAGNGLGRELAFRMADRGCRLALVDVDEAAVTEVAKEINARREKAARSYVANLGRPEDIRRLSKEIHGDYARVDILINNAGVIYGGGPISAARDKDLDAMFQINVISQFRMIREFLEGMVKRNHGHIVAISSASAYSGLANASVYTSTKWAVNGMMDSLRYELRAIHGCLVKTSIVAPYFINTHPVYTAKFDLRVRALSVRTAAEAVIDGIEREEAEFSIPNNNYQFLHFLKLLPTDLKDMILSVLYARIRSTTEHEYETHKNTKILRAVTEEIKSE